MKNSDAYERAEKEIDAELESRGLRLCEEVDVSTFRGAALALQTITAHEWIIAGPAETGKTYAACWRLDTLLRETPKASAGMLRRIRADMDGTVLRTWERIIALRGGVSVAGGSHPEWYDYPNGSRLYIGGMDRPGKVLSGERDWIYANQAEELTLDAWETLSTRCTGRGAVTPHPMLFGDCNPGPPTHWILGRESLRVLHSRHEDNPTLYDEAGSLTIQGVRSMAALDNLTGVRKERLRFGRWVAAEGAVYDSYDRAVHLIDRFEIPPDWRRFRVVDFGYTNPFVCQWWAMDGDGRLYRYREIYRTQRTVRAHAEQIKALSQGEACEATVCDHDAEDRATMAECGINTIAAYKAVSVGIQAVQSRLAAAGDGKPRLFLMRGSLVEADELLIMANKPTCTENEIESYSWPKGADGKPVKEEPVKVDDHGMDAMRYAVAFADGLHAGNDDLGLLGWYEREAARLAAEAAKGGRGVS